jgi:hypothetical protein
MGQKWTYLNGSKMDIPGRVNDGYINNDIRTVGLLVHIVFILSLQNIAIKIQYDINMIRRKARDFFLNWNSISTECFLFLSPIDN